MHQKGGGDESLKLTTGRPLPSQMIKRRPIDNADAHHRGSAGISSDDARRKITKGLMKLWRPNANPIPRLVCLVILYKKSWPVGPSLLLLLDIVIEAQIQHQSYLELWYKLKNLDEAIKRNTNFQRSDQTLQVIRNGHHSTQPYFLLVRGDIVCSSVKPKLVPCEPHGTNEWRVLETTTRLQLEEIFRNRPLVRSRFDLTCHLSLSVASLVLGLLFLLTSISLAVALPFIIATLPLVRNLMFLYTNSRMHLLAEQLQKSTTGYDESQEIDEFDEEALPPTKDIVLGFRNTLSYMYKMFIRPSDQLFWNSDLTVSFGTVTFMNFLDKPYLLSMPFQLPDQILLPGKNNVSTGLRLIQGSHLNPFDIGLDLGHDDIEPSAFKAVGVGLSLFSSCNLRTTNISHPAFAQDILKILCPCGIARALGFRPGLWKEYTVQESIVTSNVTARFISQPCDPQVHLFAIGDLGEILPFCSFSWSEDEIIPFGQESRNTLMELAENLKVHGYHTVAISYRPCRPGTKLKLHKHNHVFLGFVLFSTHPRNQVSEFIHDLGAAGIRFVFFSTESEVTTKAFGSRLGLEMDWNSCILFSAPPTSAHLSASAFEFSDPKSKLPRGVQNVRPHLLNVDDIPLRLSLFAECDPESIAEMIKIYQENDEVVISVGLASSLKNLRLLAQADLGIVMDPPARDAGSQAVLLESMITSILCPLRMPNDASLYFFTELLREARTLFRAMIASINLFVISQSFLFLSNLWSVWNGSTSNTVATTGISLVFIPTLCFTVLLSDYESDCMKQISDSFVSREVFGVSVLKGIGNILIPFILMIALRIRFAPQNIVCVLLTLSATHIHLVESLSKISPANNKAWKAVASLTLISSFIFMMVTWSLIEFVKILLIMALTIAGSEAMKFFWRQKVYLSRRRAKLEFNTRLGMHSPR